MISVVGVICLPAAALGDCEDVHVLYRTPRTSEQACGVDSLYVCLAQAGAQNLDLKSLESQVSLGPKGVSLEVLAGVCESAGVHAMAARMDPGNLRDFGNPMILHVNGNHYIALLRCDGDNVVVFDNAVGLVEYPQGMFLSSYNWDGTALIIGQPSPSQLYGVYGGRAILALGAMDNLKQIGLAFMHHHDVYRLLPTNGGGVWNEQIQAVDGTWFTPTTIEFEPQYAILYWGVGNPQRGPRDQTGSWAYAILPFIEQENVFTQRAWTAGVSSYACPSRRTAEPQLPQNDEFGEYIGGGWVWGKTDYAANGLLILGRPSAYPLSRITDGQSQTILVGEKAMRTGLYYSGSWYFDEPFFLGNSFGTRRIGTAIVRDSPYCSFWNNWGSAHIGAAQFVFADGSVHPLSYSTSPDVAHSLMTPSGGEVVSLPD